MSQETSVSLYTSSGSIRRIPTSDKFRQLAMRWSYIVRNRSRWTGQAESREKIKSDATAALSELGVKSPQLRRIARAGVVQVNTPFEIESVGWEARVFPWEFVLSAATKQYRGSEPLTVVRFLDTSRRVIERAPKNFTVIQSAPGDFRDQFEFESERDLIRSGLQPLEELEFPEDPSSRKLVSKLKELNPDVIHITGIDSHLGAQLIKESPREIMDGLYLTSRKNQREVVLAQDLANSLVSGDPDPVLIGFNCWNSGARIAPLSVAAGANAAIGFQNTFDDKIAESFYFNFYRAWIDFEGDLLTAFLQGWDSVRSHSDKIRGTGVTLWSSTSLVRKSRPREAVSSYQSRRMVALTHIREAHPEIDNIRDLVGVSVKPINILNYSMLHNRRSILSELYFWFKVPEPIMRGIPDNFVNPEIDHKSMPVGIVRNIQVEVTLKVGEDSFPYRTKIAVGNQARQFNLADPQLEPSEDNPAGGIRVPLISEIVRSVDERMQTSLYVNVTWHDQVLYRHTHLVSLAPIDQWRLDKQDSCWLPSFVQPRDPAITKIIDMAQKYLRCIEDDPDASFRGYQADDIDPQVKAIWSSIVYDYWLDYISPPPSYAENSQRLRMPSHVIDQNRGTCIDLTILLVACLEWIELFPVIFMTNDHAFPGYWATEDAHKDFLSFTEKIQMEVKEAGPKQSREIPWVCGPDTFAEIKRFVDEERLIPLEGISLTERSSFHGSYEYACRYFDPEDEDEDGESLYIEKKFESMIDIGHSRQYDVTPLPLWAPR